MFVDERRETLGDGVYEADRAVRLRQVIVSFPDFAQH